MYAAKEQSSGQEDFLAELDQLRRARGLSLQRLSNRTGIPTSTLHHWLTKAKRLPSWDDVHKVVAACEADDAAWLRAWRRAGQARRAGSAAGPVSTQVAAEPSAVGLAVPAQLPADVADFTGRAALLTELNRIVEESTDTVPVLVLSGPSGAGKSALAVHWAHTVRTRFPDGQLMVGLRGTHSDPRDPAEVLAEFLRAFGVDDTALPRDCEERARQFRSQVAGRRVLIVLDDASGAAQVRPLLPGTPGCAVVVTSRWALADLEGAYHIPVGMLSSAEAHDLLGRLVGAHRLDGEPAAAQDIVRLCGSLPLALRIVGAKLATRPQRRLGPLAARLADERRRLDELRVADLEVRSGFRLSYRGLGTELQRVLAMLGLLPAMSFASWSVAALLGVSAGEAERSLEALVDAHLVEAVGEDPADQTRYRLHDLVGLFVRERLAAEVPEAEQAAATARLLARSQHVVGQLEAALAPGRPQQVPPAGVDPATEAPWLAAGCRPDTWYEAERRWLTATVRLAAEQCLWERTWRLAAGMTELYDVGSHWDEWATANAIGLHAAEQTGDQTAIGIIRRGIGRLHMERGEYPAAERALTAALSGLGRPASDYQAALTMAWLGETYEAEGRFEAARRAFEPVLQALRNAGDLRATGWALRGLGIVARRQGRLDDAEPLLREAIEIFQCSADDFSLAYATISLGKLYCSRGQLDDALACLQRSLVLLDRLGGRRAKATVLLSLGQTYLQRDSLPEAEQHLQECLEIATEFDDRPGRGYALYGLGESAARRKAFGQARTRLAECRHLFAELGLPEWEGKAVAALAALPGPPAEAAGPALAETAGPGPVPTQPPAPAPVRVVTAGRTSRPAPNRSR